MKKSRRLLALVLACLLSLSLAACGRDDGEEEDDPSAERTEITIVISGARLPYSLKEGGDWSGVTADYENWEEEWSGVESDMWREIITRTGWALTVIQTDFSSVFGELDSGRPDLAANYYSVNEERLDKYYASIPWSSDPQVIITNADNADITTFEDLRGCRIAVTAGQTSQTLVDEIKDEYDWEVVTYEGINGYEDLIYGRVDALAGSATTVAEVSETNGYTYHYLDDALEGGNVVYFAPKTEAGRALLDELDVILEDMLADGTVSAILEKWVYADMTRYIVD